MVEVKRLISAISGLLILNSVTINAHDDFSEKSFDIDQFCHTWLSMQKKYSELSYDLDHKGLRDLEKTYYHPFWEGVKHDIKQLILGAPNQNFLCLSIIELTMLVTGWAKRQEYELTFLKQYPSKKVASLINSYRESQIGQREKECRELNCSANALHLLCYAAKILDLHESPEVLMEFGGGYGCLAHIFKQLLPNCTLFLVDIPELLALQYLYLQYNFPQTTIILHSNVNKEFQQGAIHLIPVHILKDLNINADVFVSTFAISESPTSVQQIVCDKKFFGARTLYLAGQLNGWNHMFEDHSLLCKTAREVYSSSMCTPFYYTFDSNLESYELVAINRRQ